MFALTLKKIMTKGQNNTRMLLFRQHSQRGMILIIQTETKPISTHQYLIPKSV